MYSVKFSFLKNKNKTTFHDCWNWMDRKYNILVMQCLLFGWWIMEVMPTVLYTNVFIQWTSFMVPGIPSQFLCHWFIIFICPKKISKNSYVFNPFLSVFLLKSLQKNMEFKYMFSYRRYSICNNYRIWHIPPVAIYRNI